MAEGLLDFIKTPEGQGLLATVFGGLAGAPRGQPLNSLGRAGMAGVLGYGNALDRNAQASKDAQALELQKMQMDQLRKAATKSDQFDALASKFFTPGMPEQAGRPAIPGITPADSLLPPEFRIGSDATPTIPAKPPSFDMKGYGDALMGIDPTKGIASASIQNPRRVSSAVSRRSHVRPTGSDRLRKLRRPVVSDTRETE